MASEYVWVWRSMEETQAIGDLVSSIPSLCSSCECDPGIDSETSLKRANNIVSLVNDYLNMIPAYNVYDSEDHINRFISSGAPEALVSLVLNSPTQCSKQAGEDSVKLFLYPNIRSIPKSIRKHCVRIVWENTSKYVYVTQPSDTIEEFYPFVNELAKSLCRGLRTSRKSSFTVVSTSLRLSIKNDVRLLAFFSRYMIRAIEDHVRLKGQSLPLNADDNFRNQPCYLLEIDFFRIVYEGLSTEFILCLGEISDGVWFGKPLCYTPGWPSYLSVLRELMKFSKIYVNFEEDLFSEVRHYQRNVDILVRMSKKSDDLLWLLEHKNSISSNSRDYLLMKMFPEVKFDFENQHKMLINRSEILTESFKHLSLATSTSLRRGLSVEFRNEEAVGYGVLREWFLIICQELFDPKGSLFLACPSDRRRVIALALMHKVQVGISFDHVFFLQLAGGVISLEDIRDAYPAMYKSCKTILEMDADSVDSDALGLTFAREFEEFGSRRVVELCPGGDSIIHCFVKSIAVKLSYFTRGFGDILCERGLQKIFFQSLELKDLGLMLLGSGEAISVKDWKAHTEYYGYRENDDQICWFWEVVEGMSMKQRQELLFFWTSVKFLPASG
ncbi:hypothetical protein C5167_004706, partial [Papaver somniferum]